MFGEVDIIIRGRGAARFARGLTERGKQFIQDAASQEAVFHPDGALVVHAEDVDNFVAYAADAGTRVEVFA